MAVLYENPLTDDLNGYAARSSAQCGGLFFAKRVKERIMVKQIGASVRRAIRTWLKAIYWKLNPLYRRCVALENQLNAANRQTVDRINAILEVMNRQGLERLDAVEFKLNIMNRQELERLGFVESRLKIMN
ncbi:MAG: hypothetical protein LBB48_00950, partial [Treponema sp.]|nr:hypothetical protein [Treponema sp.]